jgi:hypothetical protein
MEKPPKHLEVTIGELATEYEHPFVWNLRIEILFIVSRLRV